MRLRASNSFTSALRVRTVPFSLSGRLEVYLRGSWGTVCDDGFTMNSANTVCWQLGFVRATSWTNIGGQR